MNTIDNISFLDFGLHLIDENGPAELPNMKQQFFTVYGKSGYQITKRNQNELFITALLVANDLNDFKSKVDQIINVFKSPGIRIINLGVGNINAFAKNGFQINRVVIEDRVTAMFKIKLDIV